MQVSDSPLVSLHLRYEGPIPWPLRRAARGATCDASEAYRREIDRHARHLVRRVAVGRAMLSSNLDADVTALSWLADDLQRCRTLGVRLMTPPSPLSADG